MKDISSLIQAIASLLWPLVALWALFMFREQIKDVLARIRKGKVLGQEIELRDTLTALDTAAVAAASEISEIPPSSEAAVTQMADPTSEIDRILADASRSPRIALMVLATEIERELRQTLAASGQTLANMSFPSAVRDFVRLANLPPALLASLDLFWKVRSQLVHGRNADPDDIARAIDSGLTILKAIKAFPREINTVHRSEVPLYGDPKCETPVSAAKGIMLETKGPDGSVSHRIFATTRRGYVRGKQVCWEWSFAHKFGRMWYRDPDSQEIKKAWDECADFVGRHLDEL
jgi:hypothetical protein